MAVWALAQEGDLEALMMDACERVSEGWSLSRYAKSQRFPARLFIAWVEADPEREAMYRGALKAAAEHHVGKVVELTDEATIEDYQLKRFQSENHKWLASKFDRQRFGDDKNGGVAVQNNITIVHRSE